MQQDIQRVLIGQRRIARRVRELALRITADHAGSATEPAEITLIPILTGAMIFCCDLMRHMPLPMKIAMLTVSSYPGKTVRSQGATLLSQQVGNLDGRHVLLVDDILDSGRTIELVAGHLRSMNPASLRTCVLLRKDRPEARRLHVDYVGFEIPDEFVVGYGLDYGDYYRNLPDIVTLNPAAMDRGKPA